MNPTEKWIAFQTIVVKEIRRFMRIWLQTLLPPTITITLYFVIFGTLIGPRIGTMANFDYIQFVAPGLIMMAVITNSYSNVVSSFYSTKFQRSIEELLVSPVPNYLILWGYVIGGVARGLCVGVLVTVLALFFTKLQLHNVLVTVSMVVLASVLFSLAGFINAIFARSFDDISIIPTFVLTPLTYLGGVFYSTEMLPAFWQKVSLANPILHMINAFRYGMLGYSDVPIGWAFGMVILFIVVLGTFSLSLLNRGVRIRS